MFRNRLRLRLMRYGLLWSSISGPSFSCKWLLIIMDSIRIQLNHWWVSLKQIFLTWKTGARTNLKFFHKRLRFFIQRVRSIMNLIIHMLWAKWKRSGLKWILHLKKASLYWKKTLWRKYHNFKKSCRIIN